MKKLFFPLIFSVILNFVFGDYCNLEKNVCEYRNVNLSETEVLADSEIYTNSNIDSVSFKDCDLFSVPSEIFLYFKNLKFLKLSKQKIKQLRMDSFKKASNLEKLELEGNKISGLDYNSFLGANKLEKLFLFNNSLGNDIDEDAFYGLNNLKLLSLSGNKIQSLKGGVFEPLVSLEVIGLRDNQIKFLWKGLFKRNLKLKEIHLFSNQIEVLSSNMFSHLSDLNKLFMQNNLCVNETWLQADNKTDDIKNQLSNCEESYELYELNLAYDTYERNNENETEAPELQSLIPDFDSLLQDGFGEISKENEKIKNSIIENQNQFKNALQDISDSFKIAVSDRTQFLDEKIQTVEAAIERAEEKIKELSAVKKNIKLVNSNITSVATESKEIINNIETFIIESKVIEARIVERLDMIIQEVAKVYPEILDDSTEEPIQIDQSDVRFGDLDENTENPIQV